MEKSPMNWAFSMCHLPFAIAGCVFQHPATSLWAGLTAYTNATALSRSVSRRWKSCATGVCLVVALAGGVRAQENAPEVVRPILEEAERLRNAGRIDDAIARYRDVLRLAPHLAQVHLSIGVLYHGQGKLTEAREAFAAGLERMPDDALLLYNAAAVELQLGRAAEALAIADRGVAKHRDDASIRMIRASALRRLDRAADALEEFEQVVRIDSRNASAHLSLGNLQHQFDRKKEAVESYRQAIRHDRSLLAAHYNLGAVLYELGQDDEAMRAYDVALAPVEKDLAAGKTVDPATSQAFMNLGAIHTRKQNLPRALDAYQKAARLRPDLAAAHYNAGSILYRLARPDEAYTAYTRATELDAALPLAQFHLGLIELRRGKDDAALERFERALPGLQGAERQTARLASAHLHVKKKNGPAAEARYREVLADDPNEVTAMVALGRLLRERGAIAEARGLLDRARRAAPANMTAALETAALARLAGDDAAERAIYTDVLRRDPERADLWPLQVNLVGLLVREGAFAEATRTMDALMRKLPARGTTAAPEPDVRKMLHTAFAILLLREGQRPAATREFQAALREDASFAPALTGLAVVSLLAGETHESSTRLGAVVKQSSGALDGLARMNLGHALWLSGRGADARPHLIAAVKSFPGFTSLHIALGEIALAAGDRTEAIERLSKGVELCSSKPQPAPAADATSASNTSMLRLAVGGPPSGTEALCNRARTTLGAALASAGAAEAPRRPTEARELLDRALALPLDPMTRAKSLFLRGTLLLVAGNNAAARDDLTRALTGPLPEDLKSAARNNLGIALHRTGNSAEALRQFEGTTRGAAASAQATLNLAISLHERGEAARALPLYEQYLRMGGPRADEVRAWVEDLRRIYR